MAQISARRVQRDVVNRSDNRSFFNAGSRVQRKCDGCADTTFFGGSPKVTRAVFEAGEDGAEPEIELDSETPEMSEPETSFDAEDTEPSDFEEEGPGEEEAEPIVQPQLEVGAVDDPMEAEADRVADQVVRRQSAESNGGSDVSNSVRAKSAEDATGPATPELASGISQARGSGAAMAPEVRARMEDSMGVDLSPVRVHTGAASAAMNDGIGARAFTYGTDIHFNAGQYDPGSPDGTRLLAHELTHVIQQTAGLRRKPTETDKLQRAPKKIPPAPRKTVGFGPALGYPRGALIHSESLPQFLQNNVAKHYKKAAATGGGGPQTLFIEPGIPGANRDGVGSGKRGEPDFYTAESVIGLNESKNPKKAFGGLNTRNKGRGPRPPTTRTGPVRHFDKAPKTIGMGDLKPGHSAEGLMGGGQLTNYKTGIKNTVKLVNDYMDTYEQHVAPTPDGNPGPRWTLAGDPFPNNNIPIPSILQTPVESGGVRSGKLAIYDFSNERAEKMANTDLKGSLIVYRASLDGIYSYEWVPASAPTTIDDTEVSALVDALDRDVIRVVRTKRKVARSPVKAQPVRRKAPGRVQPVRRQGNRPVLRRNTKPHKKFDNKKFDRQFPIWQKQARGKIGSEKKTEFTIKALENVNRRRKVDVPGSSVIKEPGKKFKKVRHWHKHGKKYAWFRKTFDKAYLRMQGFVTKVKKTFSKLRKGTGSAFGSWVKAAAKALMKVAKLYAAWALDQIAEKLIGSLQTGISNITNYLLSDALPDDAKSVVETIQDKRADIDKFSDSIQTTFEESVFGDAMRFVQDFSAFEKIANDISTLVSIVEWGIRIAACGAPPLVGCLWNLAFSALQWAFSKIMETCWFTSEVYEWFESMRNNSLVKPFYDFPHKQAENVVSAANGLIPLPEGFPKVFGPIDNISKFKMDCSSGGGGGSGSTSLSPEQQAVLDLMKKLESQEKGKFKALMAMMAANAAPGASALDAARIAEIAKFVDGLSAADMKAIADGKKSDIPVDVNTFLKSLKTKTETEKKIDEKREIDYEKAKEWNPKYQKKLGWDPEKFVRKGVKPDSAEFADAVYDIQEQLGLKSDGMVGKWTIRKFYAKNGLEPDGAYNAAVAEIRKHQAAIRYAREYEAAQSKPWPSNAQLIKDLQGVQFPTSPGQIPYDLGKLKMVAILTDKQSKVGFYYRTETLNDADGKSTTIMFYSPAANVDAVTKGEGFWVEGYGVYEGENVTYHTRHEFEKSLPAGSSFELII